MSLTSKLSSPYTARVPTPRSVPGQGCPWVGPTVTVSRGIPWKSTKSHSVKIASLIRYIKQISNQSPCKNAMPTIQLPPHMYNAGGSYGPLLTSCEPSVFGQLWGPRIGHWGPHGTGIASPSVSLPAVLSHWRKKWNKSGIHESRLSYECWVRKIHVLLCF